MTTYNFNIDHAQAYGVEESILINNFQFWIRKNAAEGVNLRDGSTWTYCTIPALEKIFPFWHESKIRRLLKSLADKKVIKKGNFNTNSHNRTTWYAFVNEHRFIDIKNGGNAHVTDSSDACDENEKSEDSLHVTDSSDGSDGIVGCIRKDNKTDNKREKTRDAREEKSSSEEVEELPHGVKIKNGTVIHDNFSISLTSMEYTGGLRNMSSDEVKAVVLLYALQWACEIESGKAPGQVLPQDIPSKLNAALKRGKNYDDVGKAMVDKYSKGAQKAVQSGSGSSGYVDPQNPALPLWAPSTEVYERVKGRARELMSEGYDYTSGLSQAKSEILKFDSTKVSNNGTTRAPVTKSLVNKALKKPNYNKDKASSINSNLANEWSQFNKQLTASG